LARKWLRERLIVIDDIERKHENLSIDEILGFIDDAVQNLDCRVLLILNSDQLKDSDIWETFRERVIDQEIQLATTPDDAFTIASKLEPSPYEEPLRLAVDAMQLNNIRIIRKIIRAVTRLLQGREALSAAVLDRVVPSTALLSAIYYKGLGDGPDFDFVLSYGGPYEPAFAEAARRLDHPEEPLQDDPEAANRERWELLMSKLGIHSADEFELLVIHYLRSGLMDAAAVAKIVDRYVAEECKIEAGNRLHQFFEDSYWRPDFTRPQMLERARLLMQDVPLFSPRQVTQLHDHARDILGAPDQANEIIAACVTAFEERNANAEQRGDDSDPNPFGDELHPEIVRAIQEASARSQAPMTLLRVCRRIRERNGWGAREQALMRSVTAADYEAAIRSVTGDDLKLLLLQSMEIHKKPAVYQADFQSAADSFVQACRTIVAAEPDSRFGKLIKVVFRRADRIQDLQLPAEPAPLLPDRGEIQM
ncbi:MAG: NTPase KAP, partial [Burkholderiales bacterium]|nr:NTPase KAP [Burkholderiales bacterium]